jgi:hypothetical protein
VIHFTGLVRPRPTRRWAAGDSFVHDVGTGLEFRGENDRLRLRWRQRICGGGLPNRLQVIAIQVMPMLKELFEPALRRKAISHRLRRWQGRTWYFAMQSRLKFPSLAMPIQFGFPPNSG